MNIAFVWVKKEMVKTLKSTYFRISGVEEGVYAIPMYLSFDRDGPNTPTILGGRGVGFAATTIIHWSPQRMVLAKHLPSRSLEDLDIGPMVRYLIKNYHPIRDVGELLLSSSPIDRKFGRYLIDMEQ